MKKTSLIAIAAAAASVFSTNAMAADLGGDCCADLEERIAELEATTVRKGNRKVTLTVSGQVNELVYYWDDGVESNVYVGTSGFSSSRFRFKGDAKINEDWSAGYYMELEVISSSVAGQTADTDESGNSVNIRQSNWFLKSKRLGTITVGQQSHATDDIVLYSLSGMGFASAANYNVAPGAGLSLRRGLLSTNLEMNDIFDFIDSDRANLVRYDSPTLAGFTVSASWGEDDMWDVALRYAGEFNGIKIAGGIGYHEERDIEGDVAAGYNLGELYNAAAARPDFQDIRGSVSVMHVPTGLFVDFAAVSRDFDNAAFDNFFYWSTRAGLQRKFFPLGATTMFGEYASAEHQTNGAATFTNVAGIGGSLAANSLTSVDGTIYGLGVVQNIDAAAMELYMGYRHFEADLTAGAAAIATQDIDTVYTGARISF